MARRYIADMGPGERIEDQVFLIASKDLRTTSQGSLYIHAVLADRTGQVVARVWSASEAMYRSMPEGGFLNIRGRTENYKGSLQFIIEAIRPVDPKTVDIAEFLPCTERNIEEMWSKTTAILDEIKDPYLTALIQEFLSDAERMEAFKRAPAAIQMHHAYIGGLLEHTLNLLEMAKLIIPRYPRVSLDLVLAGMFLHDLGKIEELRYDTNFSYSDPGQLIGHIPLCIVWIEQMVDRAAKTMGKAFPDRIKWVLQHIVVSHHLRPEFGSPKPPAMPEAIAIHHLDNLDAKLHMYLHRIETDKDVDADWTAYLRSIETKLYKIDVLNIKD